LATSFDLQSHHQAVLNHINIGTLRGSAHIWGSKYYRFYIYKFYSVNFFGIPNMCTAN